MDRVIVLYLGLINIASLARPEVDVKRIIDFIKSHHVHHEADKETQQSNLQIRPNRHQKYLDLERDNLPLVIVEINPAEVRSLDPDADSWVSEMENNANEIDDISSSEEVPGLRRSSVRGNRKRKSKYRERSSREINTNSSASSESSSSGSSDYEGNPDNPYTVFKEKYKQNWLWNHVMDGDHMNLNPYGPQFNSLLPSGTALFFNRKWWYFNQDDFKPLD